MPHPAHKHRSPLARKRILSILDRYTVASIRTL